MVLAEGLVEGVVAFECFLPNLGTRLRRDALREVRLLEALRALGCCFVRA